MRLYFICYSINMYLVVNISISTVLHNTNILKFDKDVLSTINRVANTLNSSRCSDEAGVPRHAVEDGGGVSQQSRRRVQLPDTAGVQNHHPGSTTKLASFMGMLLFNSFN